MAAQVGFLWPLPVGGVPDEPCVDPCGVHSVGLLIFNWKLLYSLRGGIPSFRFDRRRGLDVDEEGRGASKLDRFPRCQHRKLWLPGSRLARLKSASMTAILLLGIAHGVSDAAAGLAVGVPLQMGSVREVYSAGTVPVLTIAKAGPTGTTQGLIACLQK